MPTQARTLTETTVRERIAAALEHATAFDRSRVHDVLDRLTPDEPLSGGDVLEIICILEIPAAFLVGTFESDLRDLGEMAA